MDLQDEEEPTHDAVMSLEGIERPPSEVSRRRKSHPVPQDEEPTHEEVISLETIERPPSEALERRKQIHIHPFSFHVLALLVPSSIFGVLTRLGLDALATYEGQSIFPLAYAQGLGCLIMGIAVALKEPFGRFYPPLYTAITTGFCGSLTTFSGWQLDVFNSWINNHHFHRGGLRDFIDGAGKTAFTLSISLGSVSFGMRIGRMLHKHCGPIPRPSRTLRHAITALAILLYGAVFPTYFLLSAGFRHQATAALLFAFPGALTRYTLAILLNTRMEALPLGTFMANTIGTALLGGFDVLQNKTYPVSPSACSLLQGLSDGYCGCLTTISTFAVEVRGLGLRRGFRYALLSWCVGQLLLLVIVGSSIWTGHSQSQITCSFLK